MATLTINDSATLAQFSADTSFEVGDEILVDDEILLVTAKVAASAVLHSDGTSPSDGHTVTIGARVYTFKTALTPAANEVLIGASAAEALDNLKSAVNGSAGAGTTYASGTVAHALVDATTNTDTDQTLVAKAAGVAGDALASTETSTHLSFTNGATFTGGGLTVTRGQQNTIAASHTGATAHIVERVVTASTGVEVYTEDGLEFFVHLLGVVIDNPDDSFPTSDDIEDGTLYVRVNYGDDPPNIDYIGKGFDGTLYDANGVALTPD